MKVVIEVVLPSDRVIRSYDVDDGLSVAEAHPRITKQVERDFPEWMKWNLVRVEKQEQADASAT